MNGEAGLIVIWSDECTVTGGKTKRRVSALGGW